MIHRKRKAARITTGTTGSPTTTTLVPKTCVLAQIVVHCVNAGTAWTLKVLDKASPPRTWMFLNPIAVPASGKPDLTDFVVGGDAEKLRGHYMEGGIDVVTAGTT